MSNESIELTPWVEFITNKYLNKQNNENQNTTTVSAVMDRVRNSRKEEIGSGISLVKLIRRNNEPDDETIANIGAVLTRYCVEFVRREGTPPEQQNYKKYESFFSNFYKYTLYMYSMDTVSDESIDDLILLARTYQRNPETFRVVVENDLPIDMLDEFQDWIGYFGEYPASPQGLEDIVTAAVSAFVGTMKEPQE